MASPLPDARLALQHPGEVEAHDLAAGLGDVVFGDDAGCLADDQPRDVLPGPRVVCCVPVGSRGGAVRSLLWFRAPLLRLGVGVTTGSVNRGQCGLELAMTGSGKPRLSIETPSKRTEQTRIALHELGLELRERADDPPTADDVDLVQTQLHPRITGLQ